jgi:hypothetical protein
MSTLSLTLGRFEPFHHRLRLRLPFPRVPVDRQLRGTRRDRARSQSRAPPNGQLSGVDFTSILRAAFTRLDSKSAKNYSQVVSIFWRFWDLHRKNFE